MEGPLLLFPLLFVLSLFCCTVSSAVQIENITACTTLANLENVQLDIYVNFSIPSERCISIINSVNISIIGHNAHFAGNFSLPQAISIVNSSFVTIVGLTFYESFIYVKQPTFVTISRNIFVGRDAPAGIFADSEPGSLTGSLSINGNSFWELVSINVVSVNIVDVSGNTITNNDHESSITLQYVVFFIVTGNVLTNITCGIKISATGGRVENNIISQAATEFGISIILSTNSGEFVVNNNSISNVNVSCDTPNFIGISVRGGKGSFTYNRVENVYGGCSRNFIGMQLLQVNIALWLNNSVSYITIPRPSATLDSMYAGIYMQDVTGRITNTNIMEFKLGNSSPTGALIPELIGLNLLNSNVTIDDISLQSFTAEGNGCANCANATKGTSINGIRFFASAGVRLIASNIYMSNLRAGSGATVDLATVEVLHDTTGGHVYGIYSNISVSDVTLSYAFFGTFIGGNAGPVSLATSYVCDGGEALIYKNPSSNDTLTRSNYRQLNAHYMLDGRSCTFDGYEPPNARFDPDPYQFILFWSNGISGKRAEKQMTRADPPTFYLETLQDSGWSTTYSGPALTYAKGQLQTNTTFFFRVYRRDNNCTSLYVRYIVTTLEYGSPRIIAPLTFSEISATSIKLTWPTPYDGGSPITNYTILMGVGGRLNQLAVVNVTTYTVTGISPATQYGFIIYANNAYGSGEMSLHYQANTSASFCGDGACDAARGESCASCFLDCPCAPPACASDCAGGSCVRGVCQCLQGRTGPNCESESVPTQVIVNTTTPSSSFSPATNSDPTSTAVGFIVGFVEIQEIDASGRVVNSYDLRHQLFTVQPGQVTSSFTETIFNCTLLNRATIIAHLFVVSQDSSFSFANETLHVGANSVKYSMEIQNWSFVQYSNKLKVMMESKTNEKGNDKCVTVSSSQTTNDPNLLWLKLNVNGVALYGKFAEVAEIDGAIKRVQFSYNYESKYIEALVPHFWRTAVFDPNFQVLLDAKSNKCNSKSGKFTTGKIAGIAAGAAAGVGILAVYYFC